VELNGALKIVKKIIRKSIGGKVVKKGEKLKVIKTISTIEGTLYENEIVKFEQKEDGHYHVKDTMGKIWFVDKNNLTEI
jgi:hypothetical protein